jgi:hypothetical protein
MARGRINNTLNAHRIHEGGLEGVGRGVDGVV